MGIDGHRWVGPPVGIGQPPRRVARNPGQPKRPMTQRQLEVLAAQNPTVAARMKDGFYKDRLREPGSPMPSAPARRRAKTASLPADPGQTRSKPGQTRSGTGSTPGKTRSA